MYRESILYSSASSHHAILLLCSLDCQRNLGSKHLVPDAAAYAEAILVIQEVVGKVMLLQLLVVGRQVLVVQEVVSAVVTDVAEDAAAEHSSRHVPVPVEDGVGQFVEWCC